MNFLLKKGYDYTDRYFNCPLCDRLLPLGEITKPLPDDFRYCTGEDDIVGGNLYYDSTMSYDDIMKYGSYENLYGHPPDIDVDKYHEEEGMKEWEKRLEAEKTIIPPTNKVPEVTLSQHMVF